MITIRSTRYPQMRVNTPAGPVVFADGIAEATADQAAALAGVAEEYGITVDATTDSEPVGVPARPAKSASKGDWVAFAVFQGMLPEVAEAMTRDQLAELRTEGGDGGAGDH
ncbi:hypothetical protein [Streptomyces jumonjinensis]|uniref:Uncharacterized protein n=1 Tax=Streptomyces jumonjinensis TaxID=1945 RepID=A0A646KNH1_STRJU|nr:hypothetical protein [Streptomyces jumonjinensis]MQT03864.1 hypothetical protein [Streptomyces jumonjinensis]